jgi:hypothetical protein
LLVAPQELLEKTFTKILNEDDFYLQPEPGMDLVLGRHLATLMIQKSQLEDYPEENVEKLRKWIGDSLALEQRAQGLSQQAQMQQQALAELDASLRGQPGPMDEPLMPEMAPEYGEMETGSAYTEGTSRAPIIDEMPA